MAISEIKKSFSGGGRKGEEERPKTPLASSQRAPKKEEKKKDPSAFGGKPFLRGGELRQWLRRPELYRSTKITEKKRFELGKELFREDFIRPKQVVKKEKDLTRNLSRAKNSEERKKTLEQLRMIRNFLGKDKKH